MRDAADAELVELIASGGASARDAEAELCARFAPRIRLYGLRHLRDEDRALDLVQTVLIAVIEAARIRRIDDPARLDRFVLGTCRNTSLRIRERASRTEAILPEHLASLTIDPVERVDATALVVCFDRLETRARQVVLMTFVEERDADEIAKALATTIGNVRVLRHRAIASLRSCLDAGREGRR